MKRQELVEWFSEAAVSEIFKDRTKGIKGNVSSKQLISWSKNVEMRTWRIQTPALLATLAYLAGLTLNRRRTNFGTH